MDYTYITEKDIQVIIGELKSIKGLIISIKKDLTGLMNWIDSEIQLATDILGKKISDISFDALTVLLPSIQITRDDVIEILNRVCFESKLIQSRIITTLNKTQELDDDILEKLTRFNI